MSELPLSPAPGDAAVHPGIRERWERIRRLKKWLRPLPRRTNMHRYPGLKWFAATARQRSHLWSFRTEEAIPALYAGWILTMMPVLGFHFPLAVALALVLRCNLPIIIGLVMVTNPVTFAPIYGSTFLLGATIMQLFGTEVSLDSFKTVYAAWKADHTVELGWENWKDFFHAFNALVVGGLIAGYLCAFVSAFFYRRAARHYARESAIPPAAAPAPSRAAGDIPRDA